MAKGKSSQSVGRIGELSVELELTSRNWLVIVLQSWNFA